MEHVLEKFILLWEKAEEIWVSGGWAMIAIAAIAMIMFALGVHVLLRQQSSGFTSVPERVWRRWIDHPNERRGRIGELLNFVVGAPSIQASEESFRELRTTEIAPFDRDLRIMKICITAAPLLGLLGTVIGMLQTFDALGSGSGGDQTMALVASGISQALVTTMTGLVVALAGLFFQYLLVRRHDRYKTFLAHLETVCNQNLYRRLKARCAA